MAVIGVIIAGPFAASASAATPAFVQKQDAAGLQVPTAGMSLAPASPVTAGNRLVVVTGTWSGAGATTAAVTDSAGNIYVKLRSFQASDGTEMSVWTAPITAGGGTKPQVTVKPTTTAYSMGATLLEYSGTSNVSDSSVMDRAASATGKTGASGATVASGPTSVTTTDGIALGFYVDSGFGGAVTGASGWLVRENRSPAGDMTMLGQDRLATTGETPNSSVQTSGNTVWLAATIVLKAGGGAPTVPGAPTGVTASAGNASATLSWNTPSNGGDPITSYDVTPYVGSTAQTTKTVSGSPPATSTTITGLTNGTAYTFRVSARNGVGAGADSSPCNAVTPSSNPVPAFVQKTDATGLQVTASAGLTLTPSSNVTAGDRLVVLTGAWSSAGATAASVADSAGNTYVKLRGFKGPSGTEMSVWTAPITAGGATKPQITVKPTSTAYSLGATVLEYSGLSQVADATVMDQIATASGKTSAAATVASGATSATAFDNEVALGFYVDSGFGSAVGGASGWTLRENRSPASDMTMVAQDRVVGAAATPNSSATTGANTEWLEATVVLKAVGGSPTVPGAPTGVTALAGDASATVSWQPPPNGGSPITSYDITPYIGAVAQTTRTITGSPPSASTLITGLANGTDYTFRVSAHNAVGAGPDSADSNVITAGEPDGDWSALSNDPMVGIHAALLYTGDILQWDGWQFPDTTTYIRSTGTGALSSVTAPGAIFCSAQVQLPDGRIMVVGGHGVHSTGNLGIVNTTIFDPATSTWTRAADMHTPRWYPSVSELGDGRYVVISGNSVDDTVWADTPEVYDPQTNTWTNLTGVSTAAIHVQEYPISFLAPNGKVFTIGPETDKSYFLDVGAKTWNRVGGASGVRNGSAVMYRPGKVLYTGGAADATSAPAEDTASTIDLTGANPSWTQTSDMNFGRDYHNLTMLADGTVLAVGGTTTGARSVFTGVLPTEIWDPDTGAWNETAPIATGRNYHSTSILRPDGRVLVAGGGHTQGNTEDGQFSSQVYSPPYLFKGSRPTISSVPASATTGSAMTVATPDASSIASVNLVSLGANTHQTTMSQHFVPLSFTQGSGSLTVQIPADPDIAPPGPYMLFIVNSSGVPSVASIVTVAPVGVPAPTVPDAPTAVSATPADGIANLSWTAPSANGSAITSIRVTPYIGSTAQASQTVPGSPTSASIAGLTDGATYTFAVSATNAVGTGPGSAASDPVTPGAGGPPGPGPAFVQKADGTGRQVTTADGFSLAPGSPITLGDRLVVMTGAWSSAGAKASSVTDSAGNTYAKLRSFQASDGTEMSVWSAPITAGAGTRPQITVKPTSKANSFGVTVLEYSGLSGVTGSAVLDGYVTATGTTGASSATVSSGATGAATGDGLALGLYEDSGFGTAVSGASGWVVRENSAPAADMTMLAQDRVVSAGVTANSSATTGARVVWLAGTLILKAATNSTLAAARVWQPPVNPAAPAKLRRPWKRPRQVLFSSETSLLCPLLQRRPAVRRAG